MGKTKKRRGIQQRESARPSKLSVVKAAKKAASRKAVARAAKAVVTEGTKAELDSEVEKRIQGTPDQRQEASARAAACNTAINEVLRRFRCRLAPVIMPPEPIGNEPVSGIIVRASYGILPEV